MPIATSVPTSRSACAVRVALCLGALLLVTGCSTELSYARLALPYDRTQLKSTTSLEVLNVARDPAYQFPRRKAEPVLVTQSDTAIALSGRSADDHKTWLNLIVFDEFRMTAGRKYFFCIDERATGEEKRTKPERRTGRPASPGAQASYPPSPDPPAATLSGARRAVLFDSDCLIHPDVLTLPYATEEVQKIAIIRWLAERFQNDLTALVGSPRTPTQGNRQITLSRVMVSQIFQGILAELGQSPGVAKNLAGEQGIPFPHASLGEGRLRLLIQRDTAVLTIRINLPLPPLSK